MLARAALLIAFPLILLCCTAGCREPDRRVYSYRNRDADTALYQADSEVQKAFRLARRFSGGRAARSLDVAEREARQGLVTAGEAVDDYEEDRDDDDDSRDERDRIEDDRAIE